MRPGTVWTQACAFAATLRGVLAEGVAERKRVVAWIGAIAAVGALVRGGTIGFVALFVNWMMAGHVVELGGLRFEVGKDLPSLVVLAATVLVAMVFSAWADFEARNRARRIARAHLERCCAGALDLYSRSASIGSVAFPIDRQRMQLNAVRNSRHVSQTVESLILTLGPLSNLVVAGALALVLSPGTTIVVGLLLVSALPVLYAQSAVIQAHARDYYNDVTRRMTTFVRDAIARIDAMSTPATRRPDWRRVLAGSDEFQGFLEALDNNMLATERMVFATGLWKAVLFAIVLVVAGWFVVTGDRSPGVVIAYIVALLTLLEGFQQLSGVVASVVRLHPQVLEHLAIERALGESAAAQTRDDVARSIRLRSPGPEAGTVELTPGVPMLYLHPRPLRRTTSDEWLAPLRAIAVEPESLRDFALFAGANNRADGGFDAAFEACDPERLVQRLRELDRADDAATVATHAARGGRSCPHLSRLAEAAVAVGGLEALGQRVVLIEVGALRGLSEAEIDAVLQPIRDRFVFVCTSRRNGLPAGWRRVIVSDGEAVVGIGDADWLARQQVGASATGGDDGVRSTVDDELLLGG